MRNFSRCCTLEINNLNFFLLLCLESQGVTLTVFITHRLAFLHERNQELAYVRWDVNGYSNLQNASQGPDTVNCNWSQSNFMLCWTVAVIMHVLFLVPRENTNYPLAQKCALKAAQLQMKLPSYGHISSLRHAYNNLINNWSGSSYS